VSVATPPLLISPSPVDCTISPRLQKSPLSATYNSLSGTHPLPLVHLNLAVALTDVVYRHQDLYIVGPNQNTPPPPHPLRETLCHLDPCPFWSAASADLIG
jgi:hypothetical protein